MLGVWGLIHLQNKNKPRTFSKPRLIFDVLKERGLKIPPSSSNWDSDSVWQRKWDKFKKKFQDKAPSNAWDFDGIKWTNLRNFNNGVLFVQACQKLNEGKITSETDPKYEAIVEFCAE